MGVARVRMRETKWAMGIEKGSGIVLCYIMMWKCVGLCESAVLMMRGLMLKVMHADNACVCVRA